LPTKAEQSDATRRKLVAAARSLFAEHGFARTSTESIVQAAGVTRGALYHQFEDKTALFQAVYEDLEQEVVDRVHDATAGLEDPLEVLRVGCDAFLDACLDQAVQSVVLREGPSVLGWERWREIDQAYGLGMITAVLEMAMSTGAIRPAPLDALSHVVFGGLMEAAILLASKADPKAARAEVGASVAALLDGLAAQPGPAARRGRRREA
jgi:AcrR family transcriptional regulator